ncbi:PREDICTED: low affinity immunoglobulin gamma Fc region receptor II-b isoform X1 [Hipposideros armiger]|uniref:low affinity immunoglobulin gamma Fc region receptor II-b isoform X1 n=1 Tax=Hipposideros armiger TaxID=186990 RepID=UPI00093D04F7|nr:PREDICTED: low affinity immunoglobulin gamma Fc region receptor II-b isoform X1 [Hipposideros armiger]
MGAPSLRNRADGTPCHPLGHMLLWTALLLMAPGSRAAAAPPKAVLNLEPPWINLLQGDSVTLSCQGHGNDSIHWFHNGNPILTQVQPSYRLQVSNNDSGDYQCQTGQTSLSDPVHLDVVSDWLLLQTPRLVFQVGEPIVLRCHSWKNKRLYKIVFFQNGKSKSFSRQQSNFSIPHANASHSGEYHCSGNIGQTLHSSRSVSITVQGSSSSSSNGSVVVIAVVLVVVGIASLAGVAAIVVYCNRRLRQTSALPGSPEHREKGQAVPEKEVSVYSAEEAAKKEEENTITYSLLQHPEAQEQEPADYQNM